MYHTENKFLFLLIFCAVGSDVSLGALTITSRNVPFLIRIRSLFTQLRGIVVAKLALESKFNGYVLL